MSDPFYHLEPLEQAFDSSETRDPLRLIQALQAENAELRRKLGISDEIMGAMQTGRRSTAEAHPQYGWRIPVMDDRPPPNVGLYAKNTYGKLESAHSTDGIISDRV